MFVAASSLSGFFIDNYGKKYFSTEQVFWVACSLTIITLVMLYFFDESEFKRKRDPLIPNKK